MLHCHKWRVDLYYIAAKSRLARQQEQLIKLCRDSPLGECTMSQKHVKMRLYNREWALAVLCQPIKPSCHRPRNPIARVPRKRDKPPKDPTPNCLETAG